MEDNELPALTKTQRAAIEYIHGYIESFGISPVLDQIRAHLGLKAVSSVHEMLTRLEAMGYIKREKYTPRKIVVLRRN